mmetsp:Transcript_29034/g.84791  ORF Transcript_29034/g.84791 Transcript_29034/m.84791 type:complete len:337 (-) Transcript_29034:1752-2762(-)
MSESKEVRARSVEGCAAVVVRIWKALCVNRLKTAFEGSVALATRFFRESAAFSGSGLPAEAVASRAALSAAVWMDARFVSGWTRSHSSLCWRASQVSWEGTAPDAVSTCRKNTRMVEVRMTWSILSRTWARRGPSQIKVSGRACAARGESQRMGCFTSSTRAWTTSPRRARVWLGLAWSWRASLWVSVPPSWAPQKDGMEAVSHCVARLRATRRRSAFMRNRWRSYSTAASPRKCGASDRRWKFTVSRWSWSRVAFTKAKKAGSARTRPEGSLAACWDSINPRKSSRHTRVRSARTGASRFSTDSRTKRARRTTAGRSSTPASSICLSKGASRTSR